MDLVQTFILSLLKANPEGMTAKAVIQKAKEHYPEKYLVYDVAIKCQLAVLVGRGLAKTNRGFPTSGRIWQLTPMGASLLRQYKPLLEMLTQEISTATGPLSKEAGVERKKTANEAYRKQMERQAATEAIQQVEAEWKRQTAPEADPTPPTHEPIGKKGAAAVFEGGDDE